MLDAEALAFKKTVFDWEASCSEAMLDAEAVAFKETVFDWEAQLLQ